MTFALRASSRARSRSGSRPGRLVVAPMVFMRGRSSRTPAAVQDLQNLGHRDATREQQDREVVEDVRALLGDPLLGLRPDRLDDLSGLLADLVAREPRILQQLGGVAAGGTVALAGNQGAFEGGKRLIWKRRRLT